MDSFESDQEEVAPEEMLLLCARRGQANIIREILKNRKEGHVEVDINCKGTQKSNRGWTPLHLGAYFGHLDVVQLLLEHGAKVNEVNNIGDTPLHRAAHTGRVEVAMELLKHGADVSAINAEGQTAKAVTKNEEIIRLIQAAEEHEESRLEEEFMSSIRQGEMQKVEELLSSQRLSVGKCKDSFGNTALHVAAQSGQREVAVYLLQTGIDSNVKNKQGYLPHEVAKTDQMKQLLHVKPKKDVIKPPPRFEGALIKKRFVGANPMWAVLERGVLSFFRNRGDAATGVKRKGMKYLDEAQIKLHDTNVNDFIIEYSDGTTHRLGLDPGIADLRLGRDPATGEIINRQMWVNSLKQHAQYNTHYLHKGVTKDTREEHPLASLRESFQRAQAHQSVLEKQVGQIADYLRRSAEGQVDYKKVEVELQKTVKYSQDMTSSLATCLSHLEQEQEDREKELHEEKEKNRILQESLHALAVEHRELERSYSQTFRSRSVSMNDVFYDCDDDEDIDVHLPLGRSLQKSMSPVSDALSFKSCLFDLEADGVASGDDDDRSAGPQNQEVRLNGRTICPCG